jgi:hypothetical protein
MGLFCGISKTTCFTVKVKTKHDEEGTQIEGSKSEEFKQF